MTEYCYDVYGRPGSLTLLDKFRRISLYLTDDDIAKLVKFRQMEMVENFVTPLAKEYSVIS